MSDFNIEVEGGKAVRLPTAGKYCPADIVVTAIGDTSGGYDEGYEQGKIDGNVFIYATKIAEVFSYAVFPDGYEITINAPNVQEFISGLFYGASGVRKVTMNISTDRIYNATQMIYKGTSIEELVLPDGIKFSNANYLATNVKTLRRILGRLDFTDVTNRTIVNGCNALEEIYFVPNTIKVSFNIGHSSLLTDASIQSIIDGLADLTGSDTQTLTLNADVGAKLTEAQKEAIAAKNWTLVY